jgi:hypothetical protein
MTQSPILAASQCGNVPWQLSFSRHLSAVYQHGNHTNLGGECLHKLASDPIAWIVDSSFTAGVNYRQPAHANNREQYRGLPDSGQYLLGKIGAGGDRLTIQKNQLGTKISDQLGI